MSVQILVVDDDIALAKTLARVLADGGYEPLLAYTAEDGLQLAKSHQPQLALLDVMVPEMGGWQLCRQIRTFSDAPIIFLTAMSDVESVVTGLELGADDYLVKPITPVEFLARIKARLRRFPSSNQLSLGNGELVIDLAQRQVVRHGQDVELTPREFALLAVFVNQLDKVISAADLAVRAWGMEDEAALDNVKGYVHHLRRKIEADPAAPRWLQTVRGVGYRFTSG